MFDHLVMYAPVNKARIITNEVPEHLLKQTKTTYVEYPEISRPVFTKMSYVEHQTMAGRLFSVEHIRTESNGVINTV